MLEVLGLPGNKVRLTQRKTVHVVLMRLKEEKVSGQLHRPVRTGKKPQCWEDSRLLPTTNMVRIGTESMSHA